MVDVKALDLPNLTPEEITGYRALLEEKLWPCLEGKDPLGLTNPIICSIGATNNNQLPVGIAIAVLYDAIHSANLLALNVEKNFRNQKIGTRLLSDLESKLKEHKCKVLNSTYLANPEYTPPLEHIFAKGGWDPPRLFKTRIHFDQSTFHPPWVFKEYHLPKGYSMFLWKDLKPDERAKLRHLDNQKAFPANVSPFKYKGQFEPLNSLGLRKDGEVIGWIITIRTDSDTIDYASIFTFPEYQAFGYVIYLLAASIRLHLKSPIQKGSVEIIPSQITSNWLAFMKKRLLPYGCKVDRFYSSSHILSLLK